MNTRLKWVGLVHRDKRTPGRFMMRMRTPNGIVTSELMRFYADWCARALALGLGLGLACHLHTPTPHAYAACRAAA